MKNQLFASTVSDPNLARCRSGQGTEAGVAQTAAAQVQTLSSVSSLPILVWERKLLRPTSGVLVAREVLSKYIEGKAYIDDSQ